MSGPVINAIYSAARKVPGLRHVPGIRKCPVRSRKIKPQQFNPDDMACHIWALSGNPMTALTLGRQYENVSDTHGIPYLNGQGALTIPQARDQAMTLIAGLAEPRTHMLNHEVYLCGGFGPGMVCPEHLWLEDHTTRRTYDTFPGIPDIVRVNRVGVPGQNFQPGCEAHPMLARRIRRVRLDGYTLYQCTYLPYAVQGT